MLFERKQPGKVFIYQLIRLYHYLNINNLYKLGVFLPIYQVVMLSERKQPV